ncbi:hypothetical protein PTW32_09725 [Dechloromonas agitata]|uniref:hypothetical protein n=1 Tax=Dechloromonas agitata TaxID=73030 RepID=UPI00237DF96D|nr:hypothetical protein [Dechloromonas agitata]MDE1545701.1 hypothetical protein [Dechloromonas agitata]
MMLFLILLTFRPLIVIPLRFVGVFFALGSIVGLLGMPFWMCATAFLFAVSCVALAYGYDVLLMRLTPNGRRMIIF